LNDLPGGVFRHIGQASHRQNVIGIGSEKTGDSCRKLFIGQIEDVVKGDTGEWVEEIV